VASMQSVTVVVVHGAWADGSSWSKVIGNLHGSGLRVIAAPIPLTSLEDDIAVLQGTLERTEGPVVLAAHAYAGAVISGVQNQRVRALCFIAALTPEEGETVGQIFYREPAHPQAPKLAPDSRGFFWLPDEAFAAAFAQNATQEQVTLLTATQRPIAAPCLQQPASHAIWKTTPSWYLIAEDDRMINPATQRFLAQRMHATTRPAGVDHTPIVTSPELVSQIIRDAAASVPQGER
jgi:pimeloyl-ACP methyl ester carboxylesterase